MSLAPASLWRHGDFMKLWSAQTISVLGSQVSMVAMPLTAILVLDASPLQVGLLSTAQYLPFVLFGLHAGAIADRASRRTLLIATDLGRAVLVTCVPVAHALGVLHIGLLALVGFLVGALTVMFDAAHQAYLPSLVTREQLVDGNTKLELSYSGARFGGAGLGGGLVQWLSAPLALLADAVSYVGSALLLVRMRHREPAARPGRAPRPGLGRAIRDGLRHVFGQPLIRPIALSTAVSGFFDVFGVAGVLLPLFAVRELHLPPAGVGLLFALVSGGSVVGALVTTRVARGLGVGRTLLVTTFVPGLALVAVPFAEPGDAFLVLGPAMLLIGLANGIYDVLQISLRQAITPTELQGRMNATVRVVVWGLIPAGALVGGLLGQWLGLGTAIVVAGVGSVLQCLPVLLSRVPALQAIPTGAGAR